MFMNRLKIRAALFLALMCRCTMTVAQPATSEDCYRIAIIGCHKQFEPAPALFRYLEAEPDLCLWIGDNVYADTEDNIQYIDSCYRALAAKPAFRQLVEQFPYMATWDDHDFGLNNAGRHYPLKKQSKQLFRRFWNLTDELPAARAGVYYAKVHRHRDRKIQVIMLDVRYNRDDPGTNGDVLGNRQWEWLSEQLEEEADLRILVSGFQILLNAGTGSETWADFPDARTRLLRLIREKQVEDLVFVTGDQHYGEVCRLNQALDYDAVELQFAGVNQIEKPEFNEYRVSNVIESKHSYAVLDVYFEENKFDVPHLEFQVYDALSNERELFYRVNLTELELKTAFRTDTLFTGEHELRLDQNYPGLTIRYTLDGSVPTRQSPAYAAPVILDKTTTVTTRYFGENGHPRSGASAQRYTRLDALPAIDREKSESGLQYSYYEGNFSDIPDFSALQPKKRGIAGNFDVAEIAGRPDHYAILFEGLLDVPAEGVYQFYTHSDDGSRLFIAGQLVVDNSGSHSARKRTGYIPLEQGRHRIRVEYFEDYDGQTLKVGYGFNGGAERLLPIAWLSHYIIPKE